MSRNTPHGIKLIIDLDGVVANFASAVLHWHGIPRQSVRLNRWDHEVFEIQPTYKELLAKPEFHEKLLKPYLHAKEAVGGLWDSGYEITIATNREPETQPYVVHWLHHWGIPFDNLILTDNKNLAGKHILVEDRPEAVRAYTDRVGPGILVRQGWNQKWDVGDFKGPYPVYIEKSWDGVVQTIRNLVNVQRIAGVR